MSLSATRLLDDFLTAVANLHWPSLLAHMECLRRRSMRLCPSRWQLVHDHANVVRVYQNAKHSSHRVGICRALVRGRLRQQSGNHVRGRSERPANATRRDYYSECDATELAKSGDLIAPQDDHPKNASATANVSMKPCARTQVHRLRPDNI